MRINRAVYRFWHTLSPAGKIGYIGKDKFHPSRFNLKRRLKEKSVKKLYLALKKYPKKVWHKQILASGFRSDETLIKAEIFFIKKFDSKNKGYNCTDGGEGASGINVSEETRKKLSIAGMGRPGHLRGKRMPLRTRKKISATLKGRKFSPETLRKMSITLIGNTRMKGKKHSPETIRKMTGLKRSAATRKKMSKYRTGKKHSVTTIAKLSQTRILWWKNKRKEVKNAAT